MDNNILEFEKLIKTFKVINTDKKWEKTDNGYKLIYNMEGLVTDNVFYPLVKFIFWMDVDKKNMSDEVITYLHSLNCDYRTVTIDVITDTVKNILLLLRSEKTNKELSDFIINGTDTFNKILKAKGITDFIQNINQLPSGNVPCKEMMFSFEITANLDNHLFYLRSFGDVWELTIGKYVERLLIRDVYKKIIDIIYDTDRDNV